MNSNPSYDCHGLFCLIVVALVKFAFYCQEERHKTVNVTALQHTDQKTRFVVYEHD